MRKYKKLILIPVVIIVVCLYMLGLNIIKRIDTYDEEVELKTVVEEAEFKGKININTATKEELMMLEEIGEKRAELIIKKREETGGFDSIEQIMETEDIGEGIYEKIKDEITV